MQYYAVIAKLTCGSHRKNLTWQRSWEVGYIQSTELHTETKQRLPNLLFAGICSTLLYLQMVGVPVDTVRGVMLFYLELTVVA